MKVLVVMRGEHGRGGSICGIFLEQDWDKAEACALSQRACFGPWERDYWPEGKEFALVEWTSGCDWVVIEKHEITL